MLTHCKVVSSSPTIALVDGMWMACAQSGLNLQKVDSIYYQLVLAGLDALKNEQSDTRF